MATPMSSLLEEVSRDHFPNPPATPEEIEEFEQRVSWKLDPDLRAFYLQCNGAALIQWPDSPYEILPLSKIVRARVAIRGKDDDSRGPASMYALCYVRDGNYVVLDVSRQVDGRYPLIDGDRETWPNPEYCTQIASSFSEFLEQVLRTQRSLYWLGE
ncbi:SMI1/KNR4 family protein [Archangium lansingense]|uniref:SMI1/KNR4 family protein n=1 Tax=Archangium lansingense TaxID=2995310 RepID=A0ABT4A1L8_9BACT|nr:SMI1/KNR4 family protein [Archangium lansinium]MCY1075541.1 SMI1/KNR4 family protein [Archangium lansinium]